MLLARGLQSEQTGHCWVLPRAHPRGRDTPTAAAAPVVSPVVLLEPQLSWAQRLMAWSVTAILGALK